MSLFLPETEIKASLKKLDDALVAATELAQTASFFIKTIQATAVKFNRALEAAATAWKDQK